MKHMLPLQTIVDQYDMDTYVKIRDGTEYPFRYFHDCPDISYMEERWFSKGEILVTSKLYDVKVVIRQMFDAVLSEHTNYDLTHATDNSYKRGSDFDSKTIDIDCMMKKIQDDCGVVVDNFDFIYNRLYINKMLQTIRVPHDGNVKCFQTMFIVTNNMDDVINIKNSKSNGMNRVKLGINCVDLLHTIDYNLMGYKYVVLCDTVQKGDKRYMCPFYVVSLVSKFLVDNEDKKNENFEMVQGPLYRELVNFYSIDMTSTLKAISSEAVVTNRNNVSNVQKPFSIETRRIKMTCIQGREILMTASGTKILLNDDYKTTYLIEEFLKVTRKTNYSYVMVLRSNDERIRQKIINYNKEKPILTCIPTRIDFLYVSMSNKVAIKIEVNDRVFITQNNIYGLQGKKGIIRRILHPTTGDAFNAHDDFMSLIYFVDFEDREASKKVLEINMKQLVNRTARFPEQPVHHLRCAIQEICNVCET